MATMRQQEGCFAAHDGLQLFQQCWLPEGEPVGAVVLVHGFTEHSGRYAEVAERLVEHGLAVHALDLRGHGRSEGERVFVRSFDEFVADLDVFVESVRSRWPVKKLFLLGHSMGGTILARLAETRPMKAHGLIISAPAVTVGHAVFPVLRRLAWWVSLVWPRLKVVRMGYGWISRDPQVVADFRSDPMVFHDRFPVRIGAEILHAARQVQADASSLSLPLLILQGTGDRVVTPEGSRLLHALAGSSDKTLRMYDGLYHDLLHEPEKQQIIDEIVAWIRQRCC